MDKEKLAKHHFWILLVLALILIPVLLSGVWFGVAEATETRKKKVNDQLGELSRQKATGMIYVDKLEEYRKEIDGTKGDVWSGVFEKQKDLIQWPGDLAKLNPYHFGDPIELNDRSRFRQLDQIEYEEMARLLKPTELAGGWQKCFRIVKWGAKSPTDEDVWLAVEDLCIQREIVECIRSVNQLLANFRRIELTPEVRDELMKSLKDDSFKPMGEEKYHRFVSPYWQLDMAVSPATDGKASEMFVRHRLTNMSHRRLNVASIEFKLAFFDPKTVVPNADKLSPAQLTAAAFLPRMGRVAVLPIDSDYLQVGMSTPQAETKPKVSRISSAGTVPEVFAVQQVLDSRFVSVKRLDTIELGKHSHRTADKPLVMSRISDETKKKDAEGAVQADPNLVPGPVPGGPGAGAAAIDVSTSGIPRLRYLTVTPQVRRMPIGIVVVVDQAHVQDVLRAFANSRLRFQTTQVHLTRATLTGNQAAGGVGPAPPPMPPVVPPIPSQPPIGGAMVNQPPAAEEANGNVVEMALYGLASIYEKFPPRTPVSTEGQPSAPANPGVAPPAAPNAPPPGPVQPVPPANPVPTAPPPAPVVPKDAPKVG